MSKNRVKVVIAGNTYELQGTESNEHMLAVAELIHQKIAEIQANKIEYVTGTTTSYMLTAINIADECIKFQNKLSENQEEMQQYQQGLDECIRENIALKERIDEMALEITELKLKAKI